MDDRDLHVEGGSVVKRFLYEALEVPETVLSAGHEQAPVESA
jgi:hypothetical protein